MKRSLKVQLAAGILFGATCQLFAGPPLVVRLYNASSASPRDLEEMKQSASEVLKHSGIEMEWIPCAAGPQNSVVCTEQGASAGRTIIFLRLTDSPAKKARELGQEERTLLGWANQSTSGIGIFYKIACAMDERAPGIVTKGQILGHAVAHEIGHLLLGSNDHSVVGIMKANLGNGDLYAIAKGRLDFTEGESRSLRGRLLYGGPPAPSPSEKFLASTSCRPRCHQP